MGAPKRFSVESGQMYSRIAGSVIVVFQKTCHTKNPQKPSEAFLSVLWHQLVPQFAVVNGSMTLDFGQKSTWR